uniref:hypothetical protein n=1 Tax=Lentilactobacillus hilgardii TaxID=1588 RepID=UPI00403F2418
MEITDKQLRIILSTEKEKKENAREVNNYIVRLVGNFYKLDASKKIIEIDKNAIIYKLDDGFINNDEFKNIINKAFSGSVSTNSDSLFMDGYIKEKDIETCKTNKNNLKDLEKIQGTDDLTFTIVKFQGNYYLEVIKRM